MSKLYILTGIMLVLFSCSKSEINNTDNEKYDIKDNEIWNPVIHLSRENITSIRAKSKKLYKNTNQMILLVGNVVVDFYDNDGSHISILYSDSARIDESNNDLHATGNVHVVSDSGYTLTSSELLWDNRYEIIVVNDSVMFTDSDGDTLYGIGFESDIDLERYKIFKPFGILSEGL